MAVIPVKARLITATVKVGADEYTSHVSGFRYTPSPIVAEGRDVSGKVIRIAGESGWNLELTVFQDFSTTGLARKMFNDEGSSVTIVIVDGPTTYTSTVTLVAPEIGGDPSSLASSTVSLPSSKPVLTASA